MTASGTWTTGNWWTDSSVVDTDFYDPDITGYSLDNDTNGFDQATTGLSYFCGHGSCDDVTNIQCASDADCAPNGYCPDFPLAPLALPACINNTPRRLITSSSNNHHGNYVLYGDGDISMALGEDLSSGTFDTAGSNGGTNIAIITNSCGFRTRYLTADQSRFYAGVHEIMGLTPVSNQWQPSGGSIFSDAIQWSARGATLANLILTNINAPAKNAWLTPSFTNSNFSVYGDDFVESLDTSSTAAQTRLNSETWANTTSESRDATASTSGYKYWMCNFSSCSSYAF
jgi:hypothetical protein